MTFAIERVVGLSTIQDLGLHGYMHEGLPPGGALVPELLVAANRCVGNRDAALAIEVQGRLDVRALRDVSVAIDDGPPRALRAGEALRVASGDRRCAYLAVRGGMLGALSRGIRRGALLGAGIGGPLANGLVLADAGEPLDSDVDRGSVLQADRSAVLDADRDAVVVSVIPGPDLDAFTDDALAILTSSTYRISPSSNRVGTRLDGPALPRRAGYRERSRPMTRGALEVPGDGVPIVLGPDHPTTGGYPIAAVIASAELGRFHAIRLGGTVRFSAARSLALAST